MGPWRALCRGLDALDRGLIRLSDAVRRNAATQSQRLWRYARPWVFRARDDAARYGRIAADRGVLPAGRWLCRYVPLRVVPAVLALLAALAAWGVYGLGNERVLRLIGLPEDDVPRLLLDVPVLGLIITLHRLALLVAVLSGAAALAALVRTRVSLWLLKASAASYALLVLVAQYLVSKAPATLHEMDQDAFPTLLRNEAWVRATLGLLPFGLLALLFLFVLVLSRVTLHYTERAPAGATVGDRIWRNLRTHGRDPEFRKSSYESAFVHIFFILLLPFLLTWGGCMMDPYGVPKGSGTPALQVIKVRRVQKKKKEKEYVFAESAISMYVPKLEESKVFEEVEKLTENVYEAQEIGRLGQGGGKEGGWPDGMENAKVRFIRLKYDGGDWDQDMGYGADYNMLLVFRELTGFHIWPRTEAIRIAQLKRFPSRRAPPFVYLTGGLKGGIHLSGSEIGTLRHYCLEMGGMIFADNGGGNFNSQFRRVCKQVFPKLPLVEISHDDVIFRQPFGFPNGAPPLWHHSGTQALGIKYQGRWVVFYHQGDINDAWKDGHSGAKKGVAMQAYKLGINVINYSFNQYMRINFGGKVEL